MKELILQNQNLIYALTNYFKNYPNKEDLFQVGCIGMIMAYKKYDPNKGAKFTTYATPYILGEMKKFIREDKGIKVSQSINQLSNKIEKAHVLLSQKLMKEPTYQELALYLEIPEYMIADVLATKNSIASLDEPLTNEGKEVTLQDMIGSHENLDELLDLQEALSQLSKEEQQVITIRYLKDSTQQQTADLLGMSQVQLYRQEQKILTKLKNKLVA